jgi:hypothetical protein
MGVKAEEAQHPKHVFFDPSLGVADEANAPGPQVRLAGEGVEQRAVARQGQRIDCEIAARRIFLPVAGERR